MLFIFLLPHVSHAGGMSIESKVVFLTEQLAGAEANGKATDAGLGATGELQLIGRRRGGLAGRSTGRILCTGGGFGGRSAVNIRRHRRRG
jgi:hypothetical protein